MSSYKKLPKHYADLRDAVRDMHHELRAQEVRTTGMANDLKTIFAARKVIAAAEALVEYIEQGKT